MTARLQQHLPVVRRVRLHRLIRQRVARFQLPLRAAPSLLNRKKMIVRVARRAAALVRPVRLHRLVLSVRAVVMKNAAGV